MKRIPLDSSAIASVSYDKEEKTLDVDFREGETYRYFNVPEVMYRRLLSAKSAGAFWNHVKDNYKFVRLEKG